MNQPSWSDKYFTSLTLAVLLLLGLIQIAWGEKIPINDGLGWDGIRYAKMTEEFPQNVFRRQLSADWLQRIFPAAVVSSGLRVFGLDKTNKRIIKGFEIYNLTLLLISSIIWSLLTKTLRLSGRSSWLGFCLLFINFAVLKHNFYYPVLTDTTAFALGLSLAYCSFSRNSVGILLVSIVGAFTWPLFLYLGILLYLSPNANLAISPPIVSAKYKLNTVVAVGVCLVVLVATTHWRYVSKLPIGFRADQINDDLILISLSVVAAYVLTSVSCLLDLDVFNPRGLLFLSELFKLLLASYNGATLVASCGAFALLSYVAVRFPGGGTILSHHSHAPQLFGRYSIMYGMGIVAYAIAGAVAGMMIVLSIGVRMRRILAVTAEENRRLHLSPGPRRFILGASVLLMVAMIITLAGGGHRSVLAHLYLNAGQAALYSVAKPGVFLVSHVVYFGPAVLIFLCYFRSLCRIIHRHGVGLTLYFAVNLLLALDPESRHLISAFPFVVILVTMFLDTLSWKGYHGWVILAVCLLFSKVWLPINSQGLTGDTLAFPFQYYFMNHGPWMSSVSYVIQTFAVVLTASLLYFVFFSKVWPSHRESPG